MTKGSMFKTLAVVVFTILTLGFGGLIYFSYQDYVDPKHVYGSWIEIGAPPYKTEVLTLNEQGVFRNDRLVATQFEFDGEQILIKTGQGTAIYQIAGTFSSPQLRRIQPNSPTQRFIKQGFEETIDMSGEGSTKNRRSALSNHFSDN